MIGLLIALGTWIAVDALWDTKKIKKEENVHTPVQMVVRGIIFGLLYFLFDLSLIQLAATAFVYWFVFDAVMALLLKKPVYHLGSGWLDKLQTNSLGDATWFIFKGILAGGALLYLINPTLYAI